ncbi:protein DpdJ [Nocardia sp. NBC_01730]|uniref:protein DpdJ n=1 Tax=Nocardia sp. NBC_01730 TaxID=2975998 RepID=UPI002E0E37CC|nr:protein DpdJ [Nocardia sp. NBC_01730]
MTTDLSREFAGHLLNVLEDLELPLLSWGVTDGALSESEVLEEIADALATHPQPPVGSTPEDVLDELRNRALLFRIRPHSPRRYRTRLAEGLRLATNLRQIFAPRDRGAPLPLNFWQASPQLVADYRLDAPLRRYPKRNIPGPDALLDLNSTPGWGPAQDRVAAALIGTRELSQFQIAATRSIFGSLSERQSAGVIVGAGTGSGKTMAFYLPAFASMAERATTGRSRVHTLALYPRKELLRDQLREALSSARTIEPGLTQGGGRPLRIGALYGDTPSDPGDLDQRTKPVAKAWRQQGEGLICPFTVCPKCAVGELLWSHADRRARSERLTCLNCKTVVPHGRLALTRKSLRDTPPDLLFTTTEILNRHSTNPWLGRLLGWSGSETPAVVLLDEVHSYTGTHGAQVALLLRRWRHAVRNRVTFVGLSATLKDATQFFAQLTGLPSRTVEYIEPSPADMEEDGREYAIALRGDPVSGASLLSTSIQTAMLFGRILDTDNQRFLFGSTGFLFTDDLDVTNRFYDNLRDAEGRQSRAGRLYGPVLAALRSPDLPQHEERYRDGQSWDLTDKIGRYLDPGLLSGELHIGRTSSQDAGMDRSADLTVATASLEVGFNDPRVGLVLQHRSPHSAAAFIQRRGRAGRERGTRPITIVTLSDYGRDRLSYQGYDSLFAPEITAQNLPIRNRYVLKIQASQAMLDWLGRDLQRAHHGVNPRALLTAPNSGAPQSNSDASTWLADRLEELLTDAQLQSRLARHLQSALQVDSDEAQALMWEQPRSILLAVVPTALRRLRSGWRPLRSDPGAAPKSMLPEFVTGTLFEPLNVPEVTFELPFETKNGDETRMPIAKALREAVPGRVSKRYGYERDEHRTWIEVPESSELIELSERLIPEAHLEGTWQLSGSSSGDYVVLRPYRLNLQEPSTSINDRSQGVPLWGTQIVAPPSSLRNDADIPDPSPWRDRIRGLSFNTHAGGNPVDVRRMTYGADCDLSFNNPRLPSERRRLRYTHGGKPAAMGFHLTVDAIRIELAPLDWESPVVQTYVSSPQWRSQAYFRAVDEDQTLAEVSNSFQRNWLALIYITAFSLAGLDGTKSPEQVWATLKGGSWRDDLQQILNVLYRDDSSNAPTTNRLVTTLTELSLHETATEALDRAGRLLIDQDVAARTQGLAQRAYRDSLAAAILAAALRACPDAQETDLIVDMVPGLDVEEFDTVWLTETTIGGVGVIEHIAGFYTADPRRFWSLVSGTLRPNEYEYVDSTVTRLLRDIVADRPTGKPALAMAAMRAAKSAEAARIALGQLRSAWAELDGPPRHGAVAAVSTRLLRPGSSPETDAASLRILDEWTALEQRLGFEVDARVIAYAVGIGELQTGGQRLKADQAFSMMWPRGAQARTQHLEYYQPYVGYDRPPVIDRLLIEAAHDENLPTIDVTELGWEKRYQQALAETGAVELVCPVSDRASFSDAISRIPVVPIDRDVLRVYGDLESVTRFGYVYKAKVELREAMQ